MRKRHFTVKYWYIHMNQQKNYLWVSEKTIIFTSDRNDSLLKLTATQVQSIPQQIDCTGDLRETVKGLHSFCASGRLHHGDFSHVFDVNYYFFCVGLMYESELWTNTSHFWVVSMKTTSRAILFKVTEEIWFHSQLTFLDCEQNTILKIRGAIFQNLSPKLVFIGFPQLKSY